MFRLAWGSSSSGTGESSTLTCSVTTGWTSQKDNICITTYNDSGDKYSVDTETNTTPWSNVAFQIDNLRFSYNKSKSIKTELVSNDVSLENVTPMLCAYDENGVMTAISYDEKATVDCGNTLFCENEFDIMKTVSEFENSKSVKALYWESFNSANACGSFAEIGDAISAKNVASSDETKTITVDDSMIPSGINSDYTIFAYAVPFTVSEGNIPKFDAGKHTLLGVWQNNKKITSVKYKASLYDEEKQDIVLVAGGKGVNSPVTTLIEVNKAPQFTNVSMLLGSDLSERNFTWFFLDSGDGKITYEKVDTMIDGEFSGKAKVANATREHDSSVYSKKEYYYQNKAVMTELEPGTEYCYQLSNGKTKHKKVYFSTGNNDSSCKSFKLNMSKFEIGCPYDVRIVHKGSGRVGYYKKAEDKFWIKDDGGVWTSGQNITSNSFFNHISMYPYEKITDLATAQETSFIMDDISISTIDKNEISVINKGSGKNALLDIKTETGDSGAAVFVAAYNGQEMTYVISTPCDSDGNATVSFETIGNEEYFKVFVLKDGIIPLKSALICR